VKLPPGVSLLPSGQYRWRIMIDGRTYSGTEPSPALAALRRTEATIDAGGTPDHDPTVRDIIDAHIAHAERADTTLSNWRWAYDALPAPFLARRASEVTPRIAAALWRQLKAEGAPPHQLVKAANLMAGAWRAAYLPNIWRDAPPPPVPATARIDPPSEAEVDKLIDAARELEPWFGSWLTVAAFTGARAGEVCGIQWTDIDIEAGTVDIVRNITRTGKENPTKTGPKGQRRVPVNAETLDAIAQLDVSGPWLFPRGDDQPLRPDGAAKRLERVCERTGVRVSPHQLRHFFVTQMLGDGCPVPDVAGFIGDSPKTVLQTYAHWIPSRSRQYVEALGKRVRG
jgi:integrase